MTRHFIFDIGNVLIDFDLPQLHARIAAACDVPLSAIAGNWISEAFIALEAGQISGRAFFDRYSRSVGLAWTYEEWITAWADIYTVNGAGTKLLSDLKRTRCQVHLLSNLAEYNTMAIEEKFPGLLEAADRRFFSYELGLRKPDGRIYRTVAQRLGVPPALCVFLDDVQENVAGAALVGMRAMRFSTEDAPSLREDLEELVGTDLV